MYRIALSRDLPITTHQPLPHYTLLRTPIITREVILSRINLAKSPLYWDCAMLENNSDIVSSNSLLPFFRMNEKRLELFPMIEE